MDRLYVLIYETAEDVKKTIHDALAAYTIARNSEVIIKWLKSPAKNDEILSACCEAQIALINAGEKERSVRIGRLLYQVNPVCPLVYYGCGLPQNAREIVSYFSSLFPARPILYLDQPTDREYYQTISKMADQAALRGNFIWETKMMKYRFPYSSILYFRSERNYIYLHLKSGAEYSFLGKLAEVERRIPAQHFIRAHQSYLINRNEIVLVDKQKKAVQLSTGEEIFVSKSHYKEVLSV